MIVKSMSRKTPSFGQLIGYIDRDEGQEAYRIRHNLLGRGQGRVRSEFERNSDLLAKRKNGVYLYHEIISITRARGLSAKEQKERLHDIAQSYIAARCPDNLVYGGLHQDKEHSYHYHLMISANRAGEERRLRLAKAQFRQIQVGLERHVLQAMPELEQKVAIDKRAERRQSRGEAELERRTGSVPKKDQVRARVLEALEQGQDRDGLMQAFGRQDLELYVRGKTLGVIDHESGKKHRLKTLDLELADRVEAVMLKQAATHEKSAPAGEKEKEPERQASARGAAEQRPEPTPEPKPQEKAGPAREGPAEKKTPERSERQQAWREEIDRQRGRGRDGSERERE
jgi:hypothetical protein